MASRYQNNETQKLKDGREVYRTRIYPNIPLKDTDIYIVTQGGDRLDTLAYQYYGDQSLWWIIATANNIHDATFAVADGTILRVPENYTQIITNFQK
jgi:phage tail protein X